MNAKVMVNMSMDFENSMTKDRDYKIFHSCRLLTVLIEKSEQLASNGRNKLKNAFNELNHQDGAFVGLEMSLSIIMRWVSTRKRVGVKTQDNYIDDIFGGFGLNLNRFPQIKQHIDEVRMQLQTLTPQCSDINKIFSVVNKLFHALSRFDKRFTKKIEKLRKTHNFPA